MAKDEGIFELSLDDDESKAATEDIYSRLLDVPTETEPTPKAQPTPTFEQTGNLESALATATGVIDSQEQKAAILSTNSAPPLAKQPLSNQEEATQLLDDLVEELPVVTDDSKSSTPTQIETRELSAAPTNPGDIDDVVEKILKANKTSEPPTSLVGWREPKILEGNDLASNLSDDGKSSLIEKIRAAATQKPTVLIAIGGTLLAAVGLMMFIAFRFNTVQTTAITLEPQTVKKLLADQKSILAPTIKKQVVKNEPLPQSTWSGKNQFATFSIESKLVLEGETPKSLTITASESVADKRTAAELAAGIPPRIWVKELVATDGVVSSQSADNWSLSGQAKIYLADEEEQGRTITSVLGTMNRNGDKMSGQIRFTNQSKGDTRSPVGDLETKSSIVKGPNGQYQIDLTLPIEVTKSN